MSEYSGVSFLICGSFCTVIGFAHAPLGNMTFGRRTFVFPMDLILSVRMGSVRKDEQEAVMIIS
jgi:hypothetical protein